MGFSIGGGACFREARAHANKWDSGAAAGMVSSIFLGKAKGGGGGAGGGGGGSFSGPKRVGTGLFDSLVPL